jgi:hypothetical protein
MRKFIILSQIEPIELTSGTKETFKFLLNREMIDAYLPGDHFEILFKTDL